MIFSKPPRTPEYLAQKLISNGLQDCEVVSREEYEIHQEQQEREVNNYGIQL